MSHKIGSTAMLPAVACINCQKPLNAAIGVDHESAPSSGDVTTCLYCGYLMAFDEDLRFRDLTDEEIKEVAGDETILAMQAARVKP